MIRHVTFGYLIYMMSSCHYLGLLILFKKTTFECRVTGDEFWALLVNAKVEKCTAMTFWNLSRRPSAISHAGKAGVSYDLSGIACSTPENMICTRNSHRACGAPNSELSF